VKSNTVEAAARQQQNYHDSEQVRLQVGQATVVDGTRDSERLKRLLNVRIEMNNKDRIVHVNRLRPL